MYTFTYEMTIDEEGEMHFSIYTKDYDCGTKLAKFLHEMMLYNLSVMTTVKKNSDQK